MYVTGRRQVYMSGTRAPGLLGLAQWRARNGLPVSSSAPSCAMQPPPQLLLLLLLPRKRRKEERSPHDRLQLLAEPDAAAQAQVQAQHERD